jgi:hypothetical protein
VVLDLVAVHVLVMEQTEHSILNGHGHPFLRYPFLHTTIYNISIYMKSI